MPAPRKRFVIRNGQCVEVGQVEGGQEGASAFVHDDTMAPLRHPITGHIYESKSRYVRATKRQGAEIVGNELQSAKPHKIQDNLPEHVIMDRIERAESIANDPTKMRARENENNERRERINHLLKTRY